MSFYVRKDECRKISKPRTLEARVVDGVLENFNGGPVPLKEGSFIKVMASSNDLKGELIKENLNICREYKLICEGEEVAFSLSVKERDKINKCFLDMLTNLRLGDFDSERYSIIDCKERMFFKFRIGPSKKSGVFMVTKGGVFYSIIGDVPILPDGLELSEPKKIDSFNKLLTQISRIYETHRYSNGGNIYERLFYKGKDELWYPLAEKRDHYEKKAKDEIEKKRWNFFCKSLKTNIIDMTIS